MTQDKTVIMRTLKRISDLRAQLVSEYPFFGRLLLHLTPGLADCGTACTDMTHLIFDPTFAERLQPAEMKFVMLHETMHCVLKHCVRGRTLNSFLYNVACDIVVNSLIFEALGVSSFSVNGEEPMHLTPDGQEGRYFTAEDVYAMLLQKEKMNSMLPGDNGNASSVENQGTESDLFENGHGVSNPDRHYPGLVDDHTIWKDISDADMQKLSDKWEARIRSASKSCGSGSGIPYSIKRYLAETDHMSRTNWKQVLADFIRHNRADYTFMRRDVRYTGDIIMPAFVEDLYGDTVNNLWFCVDTSGSISDDMLAVVFSEIRAACDQLDELSGSIAFFDTKLSEFSSFENADDLTEIKPKGGGGTSFYCIFNRLAECKEDERPVGIVILTDGYASIPDENDSFGVPVLWVIVNSEVEPEWGMVIHI